ncbi:MAG: hypothetical protein V3V18_09935 [Methylococcales bacterium]
MLIFSTNVRCIHYTTIAIIIHLLLLSPNAYSKLRVLATQNDNITESHGGIQELDNLVSPDGRYLVYPSLREDNKSYALFSVSTLEGEPKELTLSNMSVYKTRDGSGDAGITPIGFKVSSDSRRVVFAARVDGSDRLFSTLIDGSGTPVELTGDEAQEENLYGIAGFYISDNSRLVVYSYFVPSLETPRANMFIRSIDGQGQTAEIDLVHALQIDPSLGSVFGLGLEKFGFVPESENVYTTYEPILIKRFIIFKSTQ